MVVHQIRSTRSRAEELLLQEVEQEVVSRLEQSMHYTVLANSGNQPLPQQRERIWDAEIKIGTQPTQPLSLNVGILQVFERSDIAGKLSIVGKPGAGKTTMLLNLAQALINKAKQDALYPVPVVINLSSWQSSNRSMPDKVLSELKAWYGVRKDIGEQWLKNRRLLPLLDGLDEVQAEHQEACAQAVNQWLQSENSPRYMVLSSCGEEVASYQTRLNLNGAILLQALTNEQIQTHLLAMNRPEIWQALQQNAELLELMRIPLLLNITILSYQALSLSQLQQLASTSQKINLLLDSYIQTMLRPEIQSRAYLRSNPPGAAQTQHWLTFLARQLQHQSQTEFLIEKMQPHWLLIERQRGVYYLSNILLFGLSGLPTGLIGGLKPGLFSGVVFGLLWGLNREIEPLKTFNWVPECKKGVLLGILGGGIIGWWIAGAAGGLVGGLFGGFQGGFILGIRGAEVEIPKSPNHGIWKATSNTIAITIAFAVIFTLSNVLFPVSSQKISIAISFLVSLSVAILLGLGVGGGNACIQHLVLRFMLYCNGSIPWNYARFLNYCTERLLLQRVGGRYRFVHKRLQERFAELGNR